MKSKILQWLAIALIVITGLLHLFTAQGEYEEAAYMGYLFVANFFGALLAAFGIYHRRVWGWMLGFAVAAGSIAGYIWSRTLGMPGMEHEEWITPYGVVAMLVEGLFVLVFIVRPWRISTASQISIPARIRTMIPVTAMSMVVIVSFLTYQWDAVTPRAEHFHEVSVEELLDTSPTSFQTLEEQYGVQITQVAVTALNGIVDVRLKVIDVDKASSLLEDHAALLVGDTLILAPNMHRHTLKQGKPYIVFYPNQGQLVQTGTSVSLVFGDILSEPVAVK
jgi:hypothetical protein